MIYAETSIIMQNIDLVGFSLKKCFPVELCSIEHDFSEDKTNRFKD